MLLDEARDAKYIQNLSTKQDVITRLKKELNKAGINCDEIGHTKLTIYNCVSRTTPAFTVAATKDGGFDIIDDSTARMKTKTPTDSVPLYATYNDRNKKLYYSVDKTKHSEDTDYVRLDSNGAMVKRKHFITGVHTIMASRDIRKAADGSMLYGHFKYVEGEPELDSVEVVNNNKIEQFKQPKKRALRDNPDLLSDFEDAAELYYEGSDALSEQQLYKACLDYLLALIDSSTVNAAIKGGKNKYIVAPAEQMLNALIKHYGRNSIVSSNVDEVSNENDINPVVVVKPCDGILLRIIMTRPGFDKVNQITIRNIDKTLLFNDVRANINYINDDKYIGAKVGTIFSCAHKDSKRVVLNLNVDDMIDTIDEYISSNEEALKTAFANKAKEEDRTAKINAANAANMERLKIQRARDAKRAQRIADREAERNRKLTVDQLADELWSSDEDYQKFLDDLVNL